MANREELLEEWRNLFESGATSGYGVLSNERLQIEYRTWCLKKLFGAFEFSGVPDTWDYDYFLTNLFVHGYLAITDTPIGVIPLRCGITGVDVFEHPTTAVFANPVLDNFERNLYGDNPATDCALIKIQYDYMGVMPIVERYAALLALCDNSIAVNLRNSKVAFIGLVSSKQQAATFEKLYRDIDSGKPAVYAKKGNDLTTDDIYYNHVRETYIANDVQLLKQSIKNDFLTEVGLNNANTDKRERLIVDEVNANNDEVQANVQHWLDNIREGLKRANTLFNLDVSVKLRKFDGSEGGENNGTENTEPDANR
jgi:hypothetical protein